jgi:hypothetical protein
MAPTLPTNIFLTRLNNVLAYCRQCQWRLLNEQERNETIQLLNEGRSAASFCHQVAALVPGMFSKFYLLKNHKIAKNSTTTKAREKISTDLESFKF